MLDEDPGRFGVRLSRRTDQSNRPLTWLSLCVGGIPKAAMLSERWPSGTLRKDADADAEVASLKRRPMRAEGSKTDSLAQVTMSWSSSKAGGFHWLSSCSAAGKNKLSGLILAGGADVSIDVEVAFFGRAGSGAFSTGF